jgi:glycosidase
MNHTIPITATIFERMPIRKSALAPGTATPEVLSGEGPFDLADRHIAATAAWFACVREVFLHRVRQSSEWPQILDDLDASLSRNESLQQVFARDYANAGTWTREEMWAMVFSIRLAKSNPALAIGRSVFEFSEAADLDFDRALIRGIHWLDSGHECGAFWRQLEQIIDDSPHGVDDQVLDFLDQFGDAIYPETERVALAASDIIREHKPRGGGGPGPVLGPLNPETDDKEDRFSEDRTWMSGVICIAKLAHVWMAQLSADYSTPIVALDDIPGDALDELARRGINALWIIGIWQRSTASAKIKALAGQPSALASAYAVDDYRVADDLGGEAAFATLKARASARGIRLAVDMVPNHMGIDSRWLLDSPDDFLQRPNSPNELYRFDGPDLCQQDAISIHLEDGYWDRTDAAVVFEHRDHNTRMTRYIYHGNDGTSMPWNDTAQLDYSKASVREKVIDQIVEMAGKASIIRFDAAMTLVTRHIRRLWFPRPGEAGAIYSRALSDLDDDAFQERIPEEFWRAVVDAVAERCPDTLLVAEAFWMMEGYFVKTLGMHRVYNSAFMNLLAAEDNAKHQEILAEVLAYSPAILSRFVNYMSNPDEESAAQLFGREEKYFGVATLLATLPGLPLIGHGQIEGLEEKYGMEFRRAQTVEEIDADFVEEHRRQIFPLFEERELYAGVDQFWLFPFQREQEIDPDIYVFSNAVDGQRVLVVYNNSPHQKRGSISDSLAKNLGDAQGPVLKTVHWIDALGLTEYQGFLCLFEQRLQREFIWKLDDANEDVLPFSLSPYESLVFREFCAPLPEDTASITQTWHDAQLRGPLDQLIPWCGPAHRQDK